MRRGSAFKCTQQRKLKSSELCSVLSCIRTEHKGLSLNAAARPVEEECMGMGPRLGFLLFFPFSQQSDPRQCSSAISELIFSTGSHGWGSRLQSLLVHLTLTKCNQDGQVSFCKLLSNSPKACTDLQHFSF